jgi:hypothetical protein
MLLHKYYTEQDYVIRKILKKIGSHICETVFQVLFWKGYVYISCGSRMKQGNLRPCGMDRRRSKLNASFPLQSH